MTTREFRFLDSAVGDTLLPLFTNTGAPVNGAAGTFAGAAIPGALLITTEPAAYVNIGSLASPTWFDLGGINGTTPGSPIAQQFYNPVATAPTSNNLNLTAAQISGGSVETVLNLTATLAAGATATLPTVPALVTQLQTLGINVVPGMTYELDIYNTSGGAFSWTTTTNTGWTLNGTQTIAQNTYRKYIVSFSSLTTASLQSLGEFAITAGI